MATITTDGYTFDFPDALDIYEFDSEDATYLHFHGFSEMKAVDIVAEFDQFYLFVEAKNFFNPIINASIPPKQTLPQDLKYKYRDSYLYQLAHRKVDKPVIYICLLDNLDAAMMLHLTNMLGKTIPDEDHLPNGWLTAFLKTTFVVDKNGWNSKLNMWGTVR